MSISNLDSSTLILLLSVAGFVSFALLFVTSFVKITIVFGLLRSSMGTPQLPPNSVITGLAVILSVYIMYPVFEKIYNESQKDITVFADNSQSSDIRTSALFDAINKGSAPLKIFLSKHAHEKEKLAFARMADKLKEQKSYSKTDKNDFKVLLPAFLLSEITEAFQIGFLLFLPFLIIDLLTANILMSLGMHMLSPTSVSLPFKLLLFVSVDGFSLLSQALVASYI